MKLFKSINQNAVPIFQLPAALLNLAYGKIMRLEA
jgi:hypothetical protein